MIITRKNIFCIGKAILILLWLCNLGACKSSKTTTIRKNVAETKQTEKTAANTKIDNATQNKKDSVVNSIKSNKISNTDERTFLDSINKGFINRGAYDMDYSFRKVDPLPDYVKQVLPGVVFYTKAPISSSGTLKGFMMAYYIGKHYPPSDFNILYKEVQGMNKTDIKEKFKSILFWAYQNNYELYTIEEKNGNLRQFDDNYQYAAKTSRGTLYIKYENDEFIKIYLYEGNVFSSSWVYANTSLK